MIRFRTSEALKKYTEVKTWDNGYIVVMADYEKLGLTEEYIDLNKYNLIIVDGPHGADKKYPRTMLTIINKIIINFI